jgi:undecaprenyl-diphosphatase
VVSAHAARWWIASGAFACAALLLGLLVARRKPGAIDTAGFALRGVGVPVAFVFTLLGRWPALTVLGVLAVGIAMTLRVSLVPVVLLLATQIVSQSANALVKLAYGRPRPYAFIGRRERETSYPSGHSVTAIVFFTGFALLAASSTLPTALASALVAALLVCALGIPWSRLALGAHYVTDVAGGVLLGAAWLCAFLALYGGASTSAMSVG